MNQVFNPYLPLWEFVPDGEPHVFGKRLYIYGSHDKAFGDSFCQSNYTVWSCPIDDLSNWTNHGETYRKTQDPLNKDGKYDLFAPDCVKGKDGRYYLFYCLSTVPVISVAISEKPEGPFTFYGHVHYADGNLLNDYMPFDPACLVDDNGKIYLYYGFAPAGDMEYLREVIPAELSEYAMVCQLADDMLTVSCAPKPLIPSGLHSKATSFEGHGFYEASSIRKYNGLYYFIYSSNRSHELCYAISQYPDKEFVYQGILISNADLGFKGNRIPRNWIGNNHGSIAYINGNYYIFYHRQTNGTQFSRQGCAERLMMNEDGTFKMAGMTSCGLNGAPLMAQGSYPAAIACYLTNRNTLTKIDYDNPIVEKIPRIVCTPYESYISHICENTVIGYKYFNYIDVKRLYIEIRGEFYGKIYVSEKRDTRYIGEINVQMRDDDWQIAIITLRCSNGKKPLYLHFDGEGSLDLKTIIFK